MMDDPQKRPPEGVEGIEERPNQPAIEVSRASISQYRSASPSVWTQKMNPMVESWNGSTVSSGSTIEEESLSRSSSPGVAGLNPAARRSNSSIPRSPGHAPDQSNPGYFEICRHTSAHDYHHYLTEIRAASSIPSSRSQSANVSSSSLQTLDEVNIDPYQQPNSGRPTAERIESASSNASTVTAIRQLRRTSSHTRTGSQPLMKISTHEDEHPGYPQQGYSTLQNQVFPSSHRPRPLRTRSSHPSQHSLYSDSSLPTRLARDRSTPAQVSRTTSNTPTSSPGLFSPSATRSNSTEMEENKQFIRTSQHAEHLETPRETPSLDKGVDMFTGNKMFNEYEVLAELGRGEHGKVKLARDLKRQKKVAIKIVQRFSKQRRLARLGQPEEKVKKEVAILKKARHPNVVSLLEVIDDPSYRKVYIILEYVDLGEIVWRKKGVKAVVEVEKRRLERERAGLTETPESTEADQMFVRTAELKRQELERRRLAYQHSREDDTILKERARKLGGARIRAQSSASQKYEPRTWSLDHGGDPGDDDDAAIAASRGASGYETPHASHNPGTSIADELEQSPSSVTSRFRDVSLAGSMYGPYIPEILDERRSSIASSFGSLNSEPWAQIDEETAWVPCLTLSEVRSIFRDTVLGLEYLHYQGIIHRDLKPANLLWTADRRTKISDFGVSYLGRPIRDDDRDDAGEEDATELHDPKELSRTVGTPAFYAPELCSTDVSEDPPKISGQIDVWALGVTLYCMLFARVPFYDDNDYAMYQKICNDELFIPRKRLKAVEDPAPTPPGSHAQFHRPMNSNKRLPYELVYENIEDDLVDLLKRLLTKDPSKRMILKEVKRHAWVLGEIPDQRAWVEETDPSRQSEGKKIEVSDQDVATAISKNSIIGRAMSGIKRFVGLGPGRARTTSSATSVGTEGAASASTVGKATDTTKALTMQGNEAIFNALKASREAEHPLAQSETASPELDHASSYFVASPAASVPTMSAGATPEVPDARNLRPNLAERAITTAEWAKTLKGPTANLVSSMLQPPNTPEPKENSTMLDTISLGFNGLLGGASRRLNRSVRSKERRNRSTERSPSIDRSSAHEDDAHSQPSIAVSTAFASGLVNPPAALQEEGSPVSPERISRLSSMSGQSRSSQHPYDSTPEAFSNAQEQLIRRHVLEAEASRAAPRPHSQASWTQDECPPSPDDEIFYRHGRELLSHRPEGQQPSFQSSPPSATTVGSSSDDPFNSGMSQSESHPSIPSVVSGVSSLSASNEYLLMKEQAKVKGAPVSDVPPMMRTDDTVKPLGKAALARTSDDEAGFNGDNDEEYSDEEDEGLSFGKKPEGDKRKALM